MVATTTRSQKALATRRRMVEGAYRRFCRDGYGSTTMNAIAEESGVAVQTLYYTFHTKAALLGEAIGAAVVGFAEWSAPAPGEIGMAELKANTPWWASFAQAESAHAALDVFVTHGAAILERVAPLIAAMHGGAGDPEAEAVVALAEERRIALYREAIRVLDRKPPGLRSGLSAARATDLLVVLFSADMYQGFTARNWSRAQCAAYFRQLLASQLLP